MSPAKDVDALSFEVERSARYHQRRRAHFERLHRWVMLGVIISGSAAFADWNPASAGLIATLLGALDLVVGFGTKARDHQVLYQRFADLGRRIQRADEPGPAEVKAWQDEKLAIDAEEPPIYRALEADCYNEVCRAWGRTSPQMPTLTPVQRLLMHWHRFEAAEFPPRAVASKATGA
jgi:hypothetical protein